MLRNVHLPIQLDPTAEYTDFLPFRTALARQVGLSCKEQERDAVDAVANAQIDVPLLPPYSGPNALLEPSKQQTKEVR